MFCQLGNPRILDEMLVIGSKQRRLEAMDNRHFKEILMLFLQHISLVTPWFGTGRKTTFKISRTTMQITISRCLRKQSSELALLAVRNPTCVISKYHCPTAMPHHPHHHHQLTIHVQISQYCVEISPYLIIENPPPPHVFG